MAQHPPEHGAQCVLDSACHMGTGVVVQHNDTPCEHAGTLSLDDGTVVLEGSTLALFVDGDVRVLACQHQWSSDV
jgi:hypothetical protein